MSMMELLVNGYEEVKEARVVTYTAAEFINVVRRTYNISTNLRSYEMREIILPTVFSISNTV